MNTIASIVVTLGLIVSLNGNLTYQRELTSVLDMLLIHPQADVSTVESQYLYPLNPNRALPDKIFLAAYVVTRQALRPAPDFDDRLRSLKVEPPPGYSPTAAARALNQVIDLLLERRIDLESAALILLRMQPLGGR
mgnify:CR=1 FL=1